MYFLRLIYKYFIPLFVYLKPECVNKFNWNNPDMGIAADFVQLILNPA